MISEEKLLPKYITKKDHSYFQYAAFEFLINSHKSSTITQDPPFLNYTPFENARPWLSLID